jgi:hypothetical protein
LDELLNLGGVAGIAQDMSEQVRVHSCLLQVSSLLKVMEKSMCSTNCIRRGALTKLNWKSTWYACSFF